MSDLMRPCCHPLAALLGKCALWAGLAVALAGCDMLGIESASAVAARKEAESKAVGAGCRHAARSVEQCYQLNKKADKAAVFAGWKEMNDYMRENKIDAVPAGAVGPAHAASAADAEVAKAEAAEDKAEGKTVDKANKAKN